MFYRFLVCGYLQASNVDSCRQICIFEIRDVICRKWAFRMRCEMLRTIFSVLYPSMYGLVVCCNLCQQKEQMIETWMVSSTTENTHKMVIKTLEFKAIVVYLFTNVIELILYGRKTCFKFVNFSRVLNRAIFPILDSDKIPNPGVFGHNKKCGRQTPYGFIRVAIVQIQIFMPFWG